MDRYSLTDAHREQLAPWAQKWIANAMSTRAMDDADRAAMRTAIAGLYEAAKLPQPERIVFVPSPFVLRFAGGYAASLLEGNACVGPPPINLNNDVVSLETYVAVCKATDFNPIASGAGLTELPYDENRWYICGAPHKLAKLFDDPDAARTAVRESWRMYQGGNQWSSEVAFLSFFRHIAKLPIDWSAWHHWEQAAIHGGPRILHEKFAMVSDRPELLLVDEQHRPHCEDGPFCRWRDGSELYAWHGTYMPVKYYKRPITVEMIDAEANVEVRRAAIAMYGQARWLTDSRAEVIHTDDFGTLYRKERPGDTPILMVKVVNSTPEPDGTYKDYFLRVHPELRPLGKDKQLGEPQALTARNAVASTFGRYGHNYEPMYES